MIENMTPRQRMIMYGLRGITWTLLALCSTLAMWLCIVALCALASGA